MTAPNTNVEKQARRHRGPLFGILAVLALAALAAMYFTGADELAENDAVSATAAADQ